MVLTIFFLIVKYHNTTVHTMRMYTLKNKCAPMYYHKVYQ